MKDITFNSVTAFLDGQSFKQSNMQASSNGSESVLQYHGNTIARKDLQTGKIQITNCGWETNTTKERLNGVIALSGAGILPVRQKAFIWYLNGYEWNGNLIQIN
jgi:hypothetical protein|tara:strand:+ start:2156 stop:2467 length:312 start_codon:yes stop_codon:yes gene_type:complete